MAIDFPDTRINNPETGLPWVNGDTFTDIPTGLTYYWFDPVWKREISVTGATDEKYVERAGDNMTGNLTLGDGINDKITLDNSGSANFAGGVTISSDGDVGTYIGQGTGGASNPGLFITKRDVDGTGDVAYIQGNAGSAIFKGDGSATFAGSIRGASWDASGGTGTGYFLGSSGNVRVRRASSASNDATLFAGYKGDGNPVAEIMADGSAKFAGNSTVGNIAGMSVTVGQGNAQAASTSNALGYVETPWVYANCIEAATEKGSQSTGIALGVGGHTNDSAPGADEIKFFTGGDTQVTIGKSEVDIGLPISGDIVLTSVKNPLTLNSIVFNNTENDGTYYTDAIGVLAFDENFYEDSYYGTDTYAPMTIFGDDGGGLLIKSEDGWGAVFTTANSRFATPIWAGLKVNGTATFDTTVNVRGALDLADNDVLRFGSSDDVQMVFDGGAFYVKLDNDDDLIITDENSSGLHAFRFDSSARRLNVYDNIYAGYNGSTTGYNTGVGNAISTYTRDSGNQTDTWTAYTTIAADWRGKLNEATSESTHLFMASVKDRAGNSAVMSKIDVNGTTWGLGNYYAGRTQSSTTATATNYYFRSGSGYGFHGYNGAPVTDKLYSTSSRCIVLFRAQFDDADDRKAIYMVKSDTDSAYDYDQDQYLACSAMGRFDVKGAIRSGRVESDEATPNQIYAPVGWGGGSGIVSYITNSNSYTAINGRTTANTDAVFRSRVNQTSDKVRIQADGQAYTDGAWNNSPADYAEYFEWADGNSNNEDRRGLPVVLDANGKIRVATNQDNTDNIIGVISAHPAFVGDAAELSWHGRYEKDEFGQPITEDEAWLIWNKEYKDGVPINQPVADNPDTWGDTEGFPLSQLKDIEAKMASGVDTGIPRWAIDQRIIVNKPKQVISSSYDSTRKYTPRSQRKEWDTVGLIGKLPVVKGSPVGSRWIRMGEINDKLDKYFVR